MQMCIKTDENGNKTFHPCDSETGENVQKFVDAIFVDRNDVKRYLKEEMKEQIDEIWKSPAFEEAFNKEFDAVKNKYDFNAGWVRQGILNELTKTFTAKLLAKGLLNFI
jgi:hypothetical protein